MMIVGQEYDTESANIIFDEEDIDWKVMNIRMTIDKTGHKHPSWVYTPLYTKESIPLVQPAPTKIEQLNVTAEAVVSSDEPDVEASEEAVEVVEEATEVAEEAVEATEDASEAVVEAAETVEAAEEVAEATETVEEAPEAVEEAVAEEPEAVAEAPEVVAEAVAEAPEAVAEEESTEIEVTEEATEIVECEEPSYPVEYETISLNEEFDVELSDWKCNESFRLIFDPTGKVRPHIEFLVGEDLVDDVANDEAAAEAEPEYETPVSVEEVEVVEEEPPSPEVEEVEETVEVEVAENDAADVTESEELNEEEQGEIIVRAVVEVEKQADEVVGSTLVVAEERFAKVNSHTDCTFILPDIHQYGKEMAAFIKDELIDIHMLQILTISGGINWWSDIKGCCKLFPLWTLRNEASLLNAVNFVLSGFNDQVKGLQSSLHEMFLNPLINKSVKQRWSHELWVKQLTLKQPICSADEVEKRWQDVTTGSWFGYLDAVTRSENHVTQTKASYVEPIHIYMLANILCRPIVILSEVEEKEIDEYNPEKNPLTGIYLPFEQDPNVCHRFPIVLGYHRFHFSALVTTGVKSASLVKDNSPVCVPVTDAYLELLPLHFAVYPGAEWEPYEVLDPLNIPELTDQMKVDQLVNYVHLVRVRFSKQTYNPPKEDSNAEAATENEVDTYNYLTAVRTNINKRPDDYREMVANYANAAKKRLKSIKRKKMKCKGCKKYIPSSQLGGVCVKCYKRTLLNPAESKSE